MIKVKPDVIITIICFVVAITMQLIPFSLGLFREISMVMLILFSRKKMKITNMQFLCLIFSLYIFVVNIFHEGFLGAVSSTISIISWMMTIMVFCSYTKDTKDIKLIIYCIIAASAITSIDLLFRNRLFSNELALHIGNNIINRNTITYYIFPGYLFSLLRLDRKDNRKIHDYLLVAFFLFVCLQINSRAMYFSLIVSSFFILYHRLVKLFKEGQLIKLIFISIIILVSIISIYRQLPKEYVSRQFDRQSSIAEEGRVNLWKEGIQMVSNPVFGMGGLYYQEHVGYSFADYGTHNMFVDLYISGGIIAVILIVLILLNFIENNMTILAIILPAFINFFVEAGRNFYPFMLLMISWFVVHNAKKLGITIDNLIYDIFNNHGRND